jgi:hypothetical protein
MVILLGFLLVLVADLLGHLEQVDHPVHQELPE